MPSASRGGSMASVISQRETVAGLADDADAVDRAFDLAGEPRDQRVGSGARPKKVTVDAAGIVLVDQHADMPARSGAAASYTGASRPVGISGPSARRMRPRPRRPRCWAPVDHRGWQPIASAPTAGSSQLPRCAAKISAGLPSSRSARARSSCRRIQDAAVGRSGRVHCRSRCASSPATRPRLSQRRARSSRSRRAISPERRRADWRGRGGAPAARPDPAHQRPRNRACRVERADAPEPTQGRTPNSALTSAPSRVVRA